MKILTDTLLFNMFTSYLVSATPIVNELPVAYNNFVILLDELSQDENLMKQLRRLNYTKIELTFIQSASEKMADVSSKICPLIVFPCITDRTDSRSIPLSTFAYEKAAGIHNAADNPNTTGVRLIP